MLEGFKCILCGAQECSITENKPRDKKDTHVVICKECGHEQLYPLLTVEQEKEEYDEDQSVRFGMFSPGSDFAAMRKKFSEWTIEHVNLYYDKMQQHKKVLNIGSGYGFFEEAVNRIPNRKFTIEGVEISHYRLQNYVGGGVHNLNFFYDDIPADMLGKYDFILCTHLLEHLRAPVAYLRRIKPLLSENGELVFEVPNPNCFLSEISDAYRKIVYLYEHVSYFTPDTLRKTFEWAGYNVKAVYTKQIYSVENNINWIRTGKPFTEYNQMFLPDERLEFINVEYKKRIAEMGKGDILIIEAEKL